MSCLLQLSLNNLAYSLAIPNLRKTTGTLHPFVILSQKFPLLFGGNFLRLNAFIDEYIIMKTRYNDKEDILYFD